MKRPLIEHNDRVNKTRNLLLNSLFILADDVINSLV